MNRVVITGIGIVAPTGGDTETFFASCLGGVTSVAPIPDRWRRYADYTSDIWSPLQPPEYNPSELSRIEQKQLDPVSKQAVHTAFRALEMGGIPTEMTDEKRRTYTLRDIDPTQVGVFVGTGVGGIHTVGECLSHQILAPLSSHIDEETRNDIDYPKRFNPFTVPMLMPNAPAANIAIKLGIKGPSLTYALACASGNAAIGHCFRAIERGELEMGLAGGAEYLFDAYGAIFRGFDAVRTLAHGFEPKARANRPFDQQRSGFLFSEGGAATLLMESEERAISRGARPIAEVSGYAETSDAHSIMMMETSGTEIERMIRTLLKNASTGPEEIDYINAHGTGTELNDETESALIERIYKRDVVVNSTKALIGHTFGASAAIEAAVTALTISRGKVHGMPNLHHPLRDLNFATEPMTVPVNAAISHSFAFGGHNTGLLLKRYG